MDPNNGDDDSSDDDNGSDDDDGSGFFNNDDRTATTETESVSSMEEPLLYDLYPDHQDIIRIDEIDEINNIQKQTSEEAVSDMCVYCKRKTCCMIEFEEEFSLECALLKETYNRQVAGDSSLSSKLRHHRKHHYNLRCRQWICLKMNDLVQDGFPFRPRVGLRGTNSQLNWLFEFPNCISTRVIQEFSKPHYTDSEDEYDSDSDAPDENLGAPLPRFSGVGRREYAAYCHSNEYAAYCRSNGSNESVSPYSATTSHTR